MNRSGQTTLVSLLISGVIVLIAAVAFSMTIKNSLKTSRRLEETLVAQSYTAELVEFFRSFSTASLQNFLSAQVPAFMYCSHLNIANRFTTAKLNPWPLLDLPNSTPLGPGNDIQLGPNRYIQVDVVDKTTLTVVNTAARPWCSRSFSTPILPFAPNEVLLVSVYTTFFHKGEGRAPASAAEVDFLSPGSKIPLRSVVLSAALTQSSL